MQMKLALAKSLSYPLQNSGSKSPSLRRFAMPSFSAVRRRLLSRPIEAFLRDVWNDAYTKRSASAFSRDREIEADINHRPHDQEARQAG
jgi:hypothetical protein